MRKEKGLLSKRKRLLAEIILHVFDYIDTGDVQEKEFATDKLKSFAKLYHININNKRPKRSTSLFLKDHYRDFILNKKGYNVTIQNLLNSLTN